jgi:hypothetical protein
VFFISVFFYDGLLVLSKVSENCKDAYGALVLVNNSIITAVELGTGLADVLWSNILGTAVLPSA